MKTLFVRGKLDQRRKVSIVIPPSLQVEEVQQSHASENPYIWRSQRHALSLSDYFENLDSNLEDGHISSVYLLGLDIFE